MPYNVCIEAEASTNTNRPIDFTPSASGGAYLSGLGNSSEYAEFVFTGVPSGNFLVSTLAAGSNAVTDFALIIDGGTPIVVTINSTGGGFVFVNNDTSIGSLSAGSHTIRVQGVGSINLDKICLNEIVPPPVAPPVAPPTAPPTAPPVAPPVAPPPAPPVLIEFFLKPKSETPERDECTGACFTTICFEKQAGQVVGSINNALLYKLPNQTTPVDAKVLIGNQVCFKILTPQVGDKYMVKVQTYQV